MLKWIGAILIITASFGFGMMIALLHKKEVSSMKNLISALDFMECELQYRMSALPELCRQTAEECSGPLRTVFLNLSKELENQIAPDVRCCMQTSLSITQNLPVQTRECLEYLGDCLGKFDLQGQLIGLEAVRGECRERLIKLTSNSEVRLRSYQTLGLCAGAALVILLI